MVTKSGVLMETRTSLFVVVRRYGPPLILKNRSKPSLIGRGHRLFMNALEGRRFGTPRWTARGDNRGYSRIPSRAADRARQNDGDQWRGHLDGLLQLGTTKVLLVLRGDSENEIDERLKADPWTRSGSSRPRGLHVGTYGSVRWGRKFA